jgi:replication factor C small subunit
MERFHRNTQFVVTTRQPTKLIPPIRSRCFPVPVREPTDAETVSVLADICESEGVEQDDEGLQYVARYADGNLRKAVLGAQTVAETQGAVAGTDVLEPLGEVGDDDRIADMLDYAERGDFSDARSELDDLLVDEGHTGSEVLQDVLDVVPTRYDDRRQAELHRLAGEVDMDMAEGADERIHLSHLLAELGRYS